MRVEAPFVQVPFSLFRGETKLNGTAKIVWIALATRANEEGLSYPSMKTLSVDAGVPERTVYRALDILKKSGWLKMTGRNGRPSLYRLIVPHVPHWLKSGDVFMPLQNAASMPSSSTTPVIVAEVDRQSGIHTDSTVSPLPPRQATPATVADNPYPVSISNKTNRGISGKGNEPKQRQTADFAASFDYVEGRFVLGADARRKLEEDHPNVDLNATLKQIEARVLGNKRAQPIKNVLAYLETCLSKPGGCVIKKGALVTLNDGSSLRVKTYTTDELEQVEQREKTRETRPLSKAEEEVLSKWRNR
ncbi:helix-turn-helix domain-containing protein [Candidatus Cryosericum terrychapinii]|uniref:Helix-turn-helix domain-containing protein n=1 Tax=Candidatus Cryosericum terrychapinii TaxID=2290919 RepID=A0A398CQQ8_9BACT|nr:helix-turn-helix domain-containing protein [Candidatus Cryosericum terrychapinii]RIE05736.1 helix-turn-helix domain-containing protein [Candidatus Cryosericum terrychapinii]